MVIIDNKTGQVVGCVGGLGKKTTSRGLNRATQSIRQTGSCIKPIAVLVPGIAKKEFTVRDLYGEDVLVPVGETAKSFKGIIKMNNIGRFIWENLEKVETEDEIVSMVIDKYALELTQAKNDVDDFIKYLKNVDII